MTQVKCVQCGFPIATSGVEGGSVTCPSCGTSGILTRVSQAITIPGPMFFGMLGFGFGLVFSPMFKRVMEKVGK